MMRCSRFFISLSHCRAFEWHHRFILTNYQSRRNDAFFYWPHGVRYDCLYGLCFWRFEEMLSFVGSRHRFHGRCRATSGFASQILISRRRYLLASRCRHRILSIRIGFAFWFPVSCISKISLPPPSTYFRMILTPRHWPRAAIAFFTRFVLYSPGTHIVDFIIPRRCRRFTRHFIYACCLSFLAIHSPAMQISAWAPRRFFKTRRDADDGQMTPKFQSVSLIYSFGIHFSLFLNFIMRRSILKMFTSSMRKFPASRLPAMRYTDLAKAFFIANTD